VVAGKPTGPAQLLAASAGISPDYVASVVEMVRLQPLPAGDNASWALVRGNRKIPYIVAQAQTGGSGQVIYHFVNMPAEVLRGLGGNVRALTPLVETELPTFSQVGYRLKPIDIDQPDAETTEQQIDDILDLMTITQNRLDLVEGLLGAVVQNVPVVVQGAPLDMAQRVGFIQGLLALLPPSVRFAVTFATQTSQAESVDVQIRFHAEGQVPADVCLYRWGEAKLAGASVEDDYSRFMVSQLRLDASLVSERTRALTAATGWRMRQGDKLAEALAYGSYRLKVDNALLNNLPVDKVDVTKVLESDPTLTETLRRAYVLHLVKFSLAMNSIEEADPVARLMVEHPELESMVLDEVMKAPPVAAFQLMTRWLQSETPPRGRQVWEDHTARLAQARVGHLVQERDIDGLNAFLSTLSYSGKENERIAANVVDMIMPLAVQNAEVAENLLLFSCVFLPLPMLRRVFAVKSFANQLSPQIKQVVALLSGGSPHVVPPKGILVDVAQKYGDEMGTIVLARLCELAQAANRGDLMDEQVMRGIARLAMSERGGLHADRVRALAARSTNEELQVLGHDGAFQQLRVRLALGDFADVAAMLVQQSIVLYPGDHQIKYIRMIERLFAETPIPPGKLARAAAELQVNGIKGAPLVMALIGMVHGREHNSELDKVAVRAEEMLLNEQFLLDVVPPDAIIHLLEYQAGAAHIANTMRIAEVVTLAADRQHVNAIELSGKMYQVMDRDDRTRAAGLDILRAFVRRAEDREARQTIVYYGRELGIPVRNALQATYFVARLLPDIVEFARNVQIAALFLHDVSAPYAERSTPEINALNEKLGGMSGTFSLQERREFPRAVIQLARDIVRLNQIHQAQRARDAEAVLKGRLNPATTLDMMRVIAGYFTKGFGNPLKFNAAGAFPIGSRSRKVLRSEVEITSTLVKRAIDALPTAKPAPISAPEVRAEIESQLRLLDSETRAGVIRILTNDLHRLIELIELIATTGDVKVLDDSSALAQRLDRVKHKPRSALEFLRFLGTYVALRG
jgi:hypothetical protein